MASKLNLEKPWGEVKELLKEVNPSLTDEDLVYNGNDASPLLKRLASKMGRDEEHVKSWIESVSYNDGKAY